MKIAIDLSVLQSHHRFRGIGAVTINFINHLSSAAKENYKFVFFVNRNSKELAFESLDLTGINYEVRYLKDISYFQFPGVLRLLSKTIHKVIGFINYTVGDPRISNKQLLDITHYIQFDQTQKLPKGARKIAFLILYDIIPYILKYDYLRTYSISRSIGLNHKDSIRSAFLRQQYKLKLLINCQRAKKLISISEKTKNDFIKYLHIKEEKISITLLGMNHKKYNFNHKIPLNEYKPTVWGSLKRSVDLTKKPFILFSGGTDPRRKINELLAAFNNLKARGTDISLVLSGDSMDGLENLKNEEMKSYIKENTSYIEDIHLMGFVSNVELQWLYSNALAFVFPSVYEGFGLPIIEAMGHCCPVITFNNSSIREAGGNDAIYVNNFKEIAHAIQALIDDPNKRSNLIKGGKSRSLKYTWDNTADSIIRTIGL